MRVPQSDLTRVAKFISSAKSRSKIVFIWRRAKRKIVIADPKTFLLTIATEDGVLLRYGVVNLNVVTIQIVLLGSIAPVVILKARLRWQWIGIENVGSHLIQVAGRDYVARIRIPISIKDLASRRHYGPAYRVVGDEIRRLEQLRKIARANLGCRNSYKVELATAKCRCTISLSVV